jgi:hypothetical protein
MFWGSKLFASVLSLIVKSAEKCVKRCGVITDYKVWTAQSDESGRGRSATANGSPGDAIGAVL